MGDWVSIIGPMFAAAIVVGGGAMAYRWQKTIDRRTALIELRRKAYQRYLAAFVSVTNTPDAIAEISLELFQCEFHLLIVASDEVVKHVGTLRKFYLDTNDDRMNRNTEITRQLIANVCQAMREDCFEESNLAMDEYQKLVPIG